LLDSSELFAESALRENAAYAWSFHRLDALAKTFGAGAADAAVCIPFLAEFRQFLAWMLAPPCIRFADGTLLPLSHRISEARSDASPEELSAAEAVTNVCSLLQERWETSHRASQTF
jgi:hypothetical protein